MSGRCLWCERPFTVRKVGAHAKKFCSAPCKNRYHTALHQWAQQAIALGQALGHRSEGRSGVVHDARRGKRAVKHAKPPIRTPRSAARRPVQAR